MIDELKKQNILVVDDVKENLLVLYGILEDEYKVSIANNGINALKIAKKIIPDLILLDIMMPDMDGYEVCKKLKEDPLTSDIPVIFVTAKDQENDEVQGLELGAVDYIVKPISEAIVKVRIKTHLALYDQQRELDRKVHIRTKELNDSRLSVIEKLSIAAEYKDNDTGAHVKRMSQYSYEIAKEYGFSENDANLLLHAAPMHDVGKIGIPDAILLKPGKLDPDEWIVMMTHSEIGSKIIGEDASELLQIARKVAYEHHEKWNGTGYPRGISGEDIDIRARIVTVSDVFDALTSVRPYKDAWEIERAVDLINSEADRQFDSRVVSAFNNVLPKLLVIKGKY